MRKTAFSSVLPGSVPETVKTPVLGFGRTAMLASARLICFTPTLQLSATVVEVVHPVGKVYVMVAVASLTPVTTPDDAPTVAMVLSLLLQVPPVAASSNVIVPPTHTVVRPVIAGGNGLIVTTVLAVQPEAANEMLVVPAETPVTLPDPSTVAIPVDELLHEPAPEISVREVVAPWQALIIPVIAAGEA